MANIFNTVKSKLGFGSKHEDMVLTCPKCNAEKSFREMSDNLMVCPECGHHCRMTARERIKMICDKDSFNEMFSNIKSEDFLEFPKYDEKLKDAVSKTGENEAVICGTATIGGHKCALFIMDPRFIMASMGGAVGERITRTFEYATENRLPIIGFTASGGARMQEGILSLMQMTKTSAAIGRLKAAGLPYISVLTDPTTGGVSASYAMLGDINITEPRALIGFAGRRVIENTIKQKLPADFQSAEYLEKHGYIDKIVERKDMKSFIAKMLNFWGF